MPASDLECFCRVLLKWNMGTLNLIAGDNPDMLARATFATTYYALQYYDLVYVIDGGGRENDYRRTLADHGYRLPAKVVWCTPETTDDITAIADGKATCIIWITGKFTHTPMKRKTGRWNCCIYPHVGNLPRGVLFNMDNIAGTGPRELTVIKSRTIERGELGGVGHNFPVPTWDEIGGFCRPLEIR